jgi:stage V sporulation protein SpoVS
VAGIAAGIQTRSNASSDTLARGVAPEARLFSGRVCSNTAGCDATEAFVDLVTHAGVDVVNMSLGGLNPFNDGYGVEETLINRLVETGKAQFMISAGNSGPGKQTVGSPSIAARALSIGATATRTMIEAQYEWPGLGATRGNELPATDDDFMLFFSSRGPTAAGGFKPNLTAPGTELSSVQLNAAPGARGGLDVYWGTSMAAPAATGAYALLLDGVRKYNAAHPESSLPSDSLSLREALVESARGFNVKTYHPATGASRDGRTTWIDQGAGMIDLPATWKKLRAMRDVRRAGPEGTVLDAVTLHGAPVELEYNVVYNQDLSPHPLRYDGSRLREGVPTFGTGAFVDFHAENTLLPVYITRRLPSSLADQPEYGELVSQLLTTRDEFELEVEIHGSNVEWLKAGSLQQNPCWDAETSNLSLIGRAAEVIVNEEEQGEIVAFGASALNLCVNREKISRELQPGDHGALVRAYRRLPMVDAEGRITTYRKSPTASFIVPVHLVVPARTLDGESAFVVESTAASFEVSRNYITIPEGVSALRVTLEVPELKRDSKGRVLPGQSCSGVELTSMEGQNVVESFPKSADARIMNCGVDGRALADKSRRLELVRQNPTPGIWDLHIMGLYRFRSSNYRMRVDYVTGESSVKSIAGVAGALSGSLTWKKIASSMDIQVSAEKSALELAALEDRFTAPISQDENLLLEGALGTLRVYPPEVGSVVIRTGGAAGSDIDLLLVRCDFIAQDLNDPSCEMAGSSAGGTATEMLKFEPDAGHAYAILVQGYSIVGQKTDFDASESLTLRSGREVVPLTVSGHDDGSFLVQYAFGPNEVTLSTLARFPLFTQGRWKIGGAVQIRNSDGLVIDSIPVTLSQPVQE